MTIKEIQRRVKEIGKLGEVDPEAAHGAEDDLIIEVLHRISEGHPHPDRLAHAVLKTRSYDFERWCA